MEALSRRLLITGGSGFVGSHLIRDLTERTQVVAFLGRRGLPDTVAGQCSKVIQGDLNDESLLRTALDGVDAVCHLAALVPRDMTNPDQATACLETNAIATLRLARLAQQAGVKRFIYASTGNLYAPLVRRATESDPVFPSAQAPYYLASKLAGEIFLDHMNKRFGLPVLILRLSSVYGPRMSPGSLIARFLGQAAANDTLLVRHGGTLTSDFLYVDDVVQIIRSALAGGASGIYNVGSGHATSIMELATAVVRTVGGGAVDVRPPEHGMPPNFTTLDVSKAHATWGYQPTELADGLKRTWASYDRLELAGS